MIVNTSAKRIKELVSAQRAHFRTHATRDMEYRLRMLTKLRDAIKRFEGELAEALYADLHVHRSFHWCGSWCAFG